MMNNESVGDDLYAKEAFVASRGLSLGRWTTTAQKDRSHVINKIVAYLLQARRLSKKFKYSPVFIIVMDEEAVWVGMT